MAISKIEIAFTSAIILAVSLAFLGLTQKPKFGVTDRGDWKTANQQNVTVQTEAWIQNPSRVTVNYSDVSISYRAILNGVILVEGKREGISIKKGNQTKTLESKLIHSRIPEWWARHIRNGEKSDLQIPLSVKAKTGPATIPFHAIVYTDTVETDLINVMDQAVKNTRGKYNMGTEIAGYETGPQIEVEGGAAEWGQTTPEMTNMLIDLKIRNPNNYPVPVPGLAGDVQMNQVKLLEWENSRTEMISGPQDRMIAPGETEELTFRVTMDNDKIDDWFLSHVKQNESTQGQLNMKIVFEIQDQAVELPPEGINCDFRFQTAILEDQNSSSNFQGCSSPSLTQGETSNQTDDEAEENQSILNETVGGVLG